MSDVSHTLATALELVRAGDAKLYGVIALSLRVSLSAVLVALVIGMPLGASVAIGRFPGRQMLIVVMNALMGLPPVAVGLGVYLVLSRAGPLGPLGLLFTPAAMIMAQATLVTPIIAALTRQVVEDAWLEYAEQLRSLGARWWNSVATLLWDTRFSLVTVVLAGFGRAIAEVGAVLIVGGNIDGVTRVMTTTIALETTKGDLPLALALGVILIALVVTLNALAHTVKQLAAQRYG
jgi:tungstate transport system permease protein